MSSNPKDGDAVKQVLDMTNGGVHHSFEAIGMKQTAEQAFRMLARGGTANIIGMIPVGVNIELHGADFLGEKRIQGLAHGIEPLPRGYAASGGFLHGGQAQARRHDLAPA